MAENVFVVWMYVIMSDANDDGYLLEHYYGNNCKWHVINLLLIRLDFKFIFLAKFDVNNLIALLCEKIQNIYFTNQNDSVKNNRIVDSVKNDGNVNF